MMESLKLFKVDELGKQERKSEERGDKNVGMESLDFIEEIRWVVEGTAPRKT